MSKISKELGWRLCTAAALIAASYGALLLLPLVVISHLTIASKGLMAVSLGMTPIAGKLAAAAVVGKPGVLALKREILKRLGKPTKKSAAA
jgi:hypothetical protein